VGVREQVCGLLDLGEYCGRMDVPRAFLSDQINEYPPYRHLKPKPKIEIENEN
jgi:hypothetical protein